MTNPPEMGGDATPQQPGRPPQQGHPFSGGYPDPRPRGLHVNQQPGGYPGQPHPPAGSGWQVPGGHPGQPFGQPVPKRPVWKTVVGVVLLVWIGLTMLGRLSRFAQGDPLWHPTSVSTNLGIFIGMLLVWGLPLFFAIILLRGPSRR